VNINRNRRDKQRPSRIQKSRPVSAPNELLWALIGLLLTIFSTFVEAFSTNPPWNWGEQGIHAQSLGVTYQVGAILLTGCLGGKNAGALSQIAYVILGLTWLPVFGSGGGWDYWKEPSFGYILGFIPGAWLCGWLAFRTRLKLESLGFSGLGGLLVIHLCGLIYLVGLTYFHPADNPILTWGNLPQMVLHYSLAPFPGQLVIICAVAIIAFIIRKLLFY
jgi:biotin transport system substrate-specific component